jgi:hypothetical protein
MDNTIALMLADSLKEIHENLEATMHGVTEEVAHYQPQGKALSIAAAYAHAVISEDVLSSMITHEKSLIEEGWGPKLGLNTPHPMMDGDWEKNFIEWSKAVRMDIAKFQEYAKAVYKKSEDFCSSLKDTDLTEQKVTMFASMGEWTVGKFIVMLFINHAANLTGEISAVKGLQGLKGYPM